jgi:hypothetical protein
MDIGTKNPSGLLAAGAKIIRLERNDYQDMTPAQLLDELRNDAALPAVPAPSPAPQPAFYTTNIPLGDASFSAVIHVLNIQPQPAFSMTNSSMGNGASNAVIPSSSNPPPASAKPCVRFGSYDLPAVFGFETDQGLKGILEITGYSINPPRVFASYKRVQPPTSIIEKLRAKRAARDPFQFRWVAADDDTNSSVEILPAAATLGLYQPPFHLLPEVVLSSQDVDSAGFSQYQADEKELVVFFNPRGGEKFAEATAKNIGRKLAIVWRGKVIFAPVIAAPITGPRITIFVHFTDAEAQQLLDVLNHRAPANAVQTNFQSVTAPNSSRPTSEPK